MNDADVLGLLIYANELDGRHSPNEAKVYAWQEVLQESAPNMNVGFARDTITKHYANTDVMLTPATLVSAWKRYVKFQSDTHISASASSSERHCGKANCICTHGEPCFKGWVDYDTYTSPCRMCRGDLANALDQIAALGQRSDHDWSTLRHRHLNRA